MPLHVVYLKIVSGLVKFGIQLLSPFTRECTLSSEMTLQETK